MNLILQWNRQTISYIIRYITNCQLLVTLLNNKGIQRNRERFGNNSDRIIKAGFSEEVTFAQRSECSDKVSHASIWKKPSFLHLVDEMGRLLGFCLPPPPPFSPFCYQLAE